MSKDSKRFPERSKTRNYPRIIADVSQILRRDSPMHLRLKNIGECSVIVRRIFRDKSLIIAEYSPSTSPDKTSPMVCEKFQSKH